MYPPLQFVCLRPPVSTIMPAVMRSLFTSNVGFFFQFNLSVAMPYRVCNMQLVSIPQPQATWTITSADDSEYQIWTLFKSHEEVGVAYLCIYGTAGSFSNASLSCYYIREPPKCFRSFFALFHFHFQSCLSGASAAMGWGNAQRVVLQRMCTPSGVDG